MCSACRGSRASPHPYRLSACDLVAGAQTRRFHAPTSTARRCSRRWCSGAPTIRWAERPREADAAVFASVASGGEHLGSPKSAASSSNCSTQGAGPDLRGGAGALPPPARHRGPWVRRRRSTWPPTIADRRRQAWLIDSAELRSSCICCDCPRWPGLRRVGAAGGQGQAHPRGVSLPVGAAELDGRKHRRIERLRRASGLPREKTFRA